MFAYQGAVPDYREAIAPIPQGIYETSSTAKGRVGTKRVLGDAVFRYCKAGAADLGIGMLAVQATPAANHQNVAVAAAVSADAQTVTVTLGATAATLNQYADGTLVVSDSTGEGTSYRIQSNPAADASATLTLTLYDKVHTALDTTSECCLIPNPWVGTVITQTDQADNPAGTPLVAVTATYYYWSLTAGVGPALADETVSQGALVTIGTSVQGAVEAQDAAGEALVGRAVIALVDEEYRPINYMIDSL